MRLTVRVCARVRGGPCDECLREANGRKEHAGRGRGSTQTAADGVDERKLPASLWFNTVGRERMDVSDVWNVKRESDGLVIPIPHSWDRKENTGTNLA